MGNSHIFHPRIPGDKIVGKDIDGDMIPDVPLFYELQDSKLRVQFPLGFCPSIKGCIAENGTVCHGSFGIVLKEWDTITRVYPTTASYLNKVTKQFDIDILDQDGTKLLIKDLEVDIELVIDRMADKDPSAVSAGNTGFTVDVTSRLEFLKARQKPPLIYHAFNVTNKFSTINIQIKQVAEDQSILHMNDSSLIILLRYQKMPTTDHCEIVKQVSSIGIMEDGHLDWFLGNDFVASRTGKWFLAIASTKKTLEEDERDCTQLSVDQLSWDFNTPNYHLQIYIGGGYYFDENSDNWDGTGTGVINSTYTVTAIRTNHLSSFASGFLPEPNVIDFEFVFANASFQDNLTLFLLLIICYIFFIVGLIWAIFKDKSDTKSVSSTLIDSHQFKKMSKMYFIFS